MRSDGLSPTQYKCILLPVLAGMFRIKDLRWIVLLYTLPKKLPHHVFSSMNISHRLNWRLTLRTFKSTKGLKTRPQLILVIWEFCYAFNLYIMFDIYNWLHTIKFQQSNLSSVHRCGKSVTVYHLITKNWLTPAACTLKWSSLTLSSLWWHGITYIQTLITLTHH